MAKQLVQAEMWAFVRTPLGRMKMQVLKNQVPGGGIIKYGKTKYEWQGWKMQVWKNEVRLSWGGKCKYKQCR